MTLPALAAVIFYFNLITFGNGAVMVPLIQQRLVDQTHVLSFDQLLYAFAIARVTPGQANVYVASVGYFLFGLPGALLTTAVIQLPGYFMLPLVRLHRRFRDVTFVRRFIRGLTATSVGLILSAVLEIGAGTLIDLTTAGVFVLTLVLALAMKRNPMVSLGLATGTGIALHYFLGG